MIDSQLWCDLAGLADRPRAATLSPVSARRGPTRGQIRRRRALALSVIALALAGAAYLVLAATVLAPVDKHGSRLVHIEVHSKAVGRDLGINVIVPEHAGPPGKRWLMDALRDRPAPDRDRRHLDGRLRRL